MEGHSKVGIPFYVSIVFMHIVCNTLRVILGVLVVALVGKLSCLQMHSGGLSPAQVIHNKDNTSRLDLTSLAQVQHLSSCPLDPDYLRSSDCPLGFTLFKDNCYRLSSQEKTFAEAEVDCTNGNGNENNHDKD